MFYYFLWFELLSLVVALICFRQLRGSNLIWFIPFLMLTNIQEWGSHYGYLNNSKGENIIALNIFTTIEFIFYTWLFTVEVVNPFLKRIFMIGGALLTLLIISNFIFINGIEIFHQDLYLTGSILMILFACLYFFSLLKTEEYIELKKLPMFWICIGILFFYTGMFSVYMFILQGGDSGSLSYKSLYNIVSNIFNAILYSCFIIAFICQRARNILT